MGRRRILRSAPMAIMTCHEVSPLSRSLFVPSRLWSTFFPSPFMRIYLILNSFLSFWLIIWLPYYPSIRAIHDV